MSPRKTPKTEPTHGTEIRAAEIFVAKNRHVEPFIKSFIAAPENIAQESLGTLAGALSISDRSESSGYIVNALASIAKKEYFANPKRGVVESFEAALHRMNRALAELVKNGQAEWMGSLHGVIAVVAEGDIHFSATGDGKVLLYRSGTLTDISEGLASEDAARHPLKTFVEISSGRLNQDDSVLLSTPEIFGLFSPSELERSAKRLVPEKKFVRFLETAMLNELRLGAVIVLEVDKKNDRSLERHATHHRKTPAPANVFSAEAFKKAEQERAQVFEEDATKEQRQEDRRTEARKDRGFGEIYVQGEVPERLEEHPAITRARWVAEDMFSSMLSARRSASGTVRKWISSSLAMITEKTVSSTMGLVRRIRLSRLRRMASPQQSPPSLEVTRVAPTDAVTEKPERERRKIRIPKIALPTVRMPNVPTVRIPEFPTGRARRFASELITDTVVPAAKTIASSTATITGKAAGKALGSFRFLKQRFLLLPPKRQLIVAAIAAFTITLCSAFLWRALSEQEVLPVPIVVTEAPLPAFPPENEKNATIASPEKVDVDASDIITPVFLRDSLFLVTRKEIINTSTGTRFPIPSEGSIKLATGMDDLNILFLFTENKELFAFTPANKSFTKNAILLPDSFSPASMGTFLTYLYFLEEGTGKIYRFPRSEGGFGEGTLWTKDLPREGTRFVAVNENIYTGSSFGVEAFLRGEKLAGFSLETPGTPLEPTAICTHEEFPERFAILDAKAKRVVVYASDGKIASQWFDDSFVSAISCSLGRDGKHISVASSDELFTFEVRP